MLRSLWSTKTVVVLILAMTPRTITKTFIDGDIVAYRMAASADSNGYSFQSAAANVDRMIEDIIHEAMDFPGPSCFKVFLTGRGNFRYDIAKAAPYKGNRSNPR